MSHKNDIVSVRETMWHSGIGTPFHVITRDVLLVREEHEQTICTSPTGQQRARKQPSVVEVCANMALGWSTMCGFISLIWGVRGAGSSTLGRELPAGKPTDMRGRCVEYQARTHLVVIVADDKVQLIAFWMAIFRPIAKSFLPTNARQTMGRAARSHSQCQQVTASVKEPRRLCRECTGICTRRAGRVVCAWEGRHCLPFIPVEAQLQVLRENKITTVVAHLQQQTATQGAVRGSTVTLRSRQRLGRQGGARTFAYPKSVRLTKRGYGSPPAWRWSISSTI